MFFRLIYASRAVGEVDYLDIVRTSQQRNSAYGTTGGLAFLGGVFLQYLEGYEAEVRWLFQKICADPRHEDVKVLEERIVPRKMFANWQMALLTWNEETKDIFRSFSPGAELDLYQTDPSTAAPLFRAWAMTKQWSETEVPPSTPSV